MTMALPNVCAHGLYRCVSMFLGLCSHGLHLCLSTRVYTHMHIWLGFPCGSAGKESARNPGDLVPGLERSPGEGKGYPLQYSGLENSMDRVRHERATYTHICRHMHMWLHILLCVHVCAWECLHILVCTRGAVTVVCPTPPALWRVRPDTVPTCWASLWGLGAWAGCAIRENQVRPRQTGACQGRGLRPRTAA